MSPTNAHPGILDRERSGLAARPGSDETGDVLKEVINYGTNVLVGCQASPVIKPDVDLAALSMYRHMLEMADGVELLLRGGAAAPAVPLLRSMFEAGLYLQYLFEDAQLYAQRGLAWYVVHEVKELLSYERLSVVTEVGKEMEAERVVDLHSGLITLPDQAKVQKAIDHYRGVLAQPHLVAVLEEYRRVRKGRRGRVHWYQLFNGPGSLAEMAKRLKQPLTYKAIYGHWSEIGHANDLSRLIKATPDGQGEIRRLREPDNIVEVGQNAVAFLLDATRRIGNHFRPNDQAAFGTWYVGEVQQRYRAIIETFKASEGIS